MQRQIINEPARIATGRGIQSQSGFPKPNRTNTNNAAGLTRTPQRLQGVNFYTQTEPPPPRESRVQGTSIAVGTADNGSSPKPIENIPHTEYAELPQQNPTTRQNRQNRNKRGDLNFGDASMPIPTVIQIQPTTQLGIGNYEQFSSEDPAVLAESMRVESFKESRNWQYCTEGWPSDLEFGPIEQLQPLRTDAGSSFENKISAAFPDGLSPLRATRHLFIEPKPPSFGNEHASFERKFDILDSNGERLFIAAETKGTRNFVRCGRKLNLSLFGNNGIEVFDFSWKGGKTAEHNSNGQTCGRIEEVAVCCSSESFFRIKNTSGNVIYKIIHNWSTKCSYEFEVFTPAPDRTRIGKVSKTWIGLPHPDQHLAHLYGISFTPDTPLSDKTSLLVASFLLYFKYVEDNNQERRRGEADCLCLVLYFLLIMGFFLGIAISAGYTYRASLK